MWVSKTEASAGAELTDCLDDERNVNRVHGGVVLCADQVPIKYENLDVAIEV